MSRKDSKALFANILADAAPAAPAPKPSSSSSPHLRKVAAGIRHLQEREEMLERIIKDETRVLEIDCDDIADSGIRDRFDGAYEDNAIADLVSSIRESGQAVPGLVRPVHGSDHKFQIVFGRRRLAAARSIGVPFRAVVRDLTDEEAIVLQGEENSNREDLTFVERCLFAGAQEAAGFSRETICKSLSTSKSHLSEMLRLTSIVPVDTLRSIGRSPEIGRRRWLELADEWSKRSDAAETVERALKAVASSNEANKRFAVALAALKVASNAKEPTAKVEIVSNGSLLAVMGRTKSGAQLNFDKSVDPRFLEHLGKLLPDLHAQFMKSEKG